MSHHPADDPIPFVPGLELSRALYDATGPILSRRRAAPLRALYRSALEALPARTAEERAVATADEERT